MHLLKLASNYLNREFFVDFDPPLGKLLLAAVGYLSGYDGTFNFANQGSSYRDQPFYAYMRAFSSLLWILIIAMTYALLIEMKFSLAIALLGASLIAFGNNSNCIVNLLS